MYRYLTILGFLLASTRPAFALGWKWSITDNNGNIVKTIEVELIYTKGVPALTDVKLVSKPGKREYVSYKDLKSVMNGMGVSFLSTPKGILTNREARKEKLGGELLFMIW